MIGQQVIPTYMKSSRY